jgi:PHD/YefM family antitoxin component YafN of YafNO toxin-antitoxin module
LYRRAPHSENENFVIVRYGLAHIKTRVAAIIPGIDRFTLIVERAMNLKEDIQPIAYLQSNAADIARRVNTVREPVMITVDGVVQMVIQDQHTYQQQVDTIALLKILALGQQSISEGRVVAADAVFAARKRP